MEFFLQKNDEEVENAIIAALETGYRKIDTASAYQNEEGVGREIKSQDDNFHKK